MVAFAQPTRSALCDSRSDELWTAIDSLEDFDQKGSSCRNTFVVPQDAPQRFMADDLFAIGERLIIFRPLSGKWPIVQGLVRTVSVIKSFVRRDKMIEVLLTENDKE